MRSWWGIAVQAVVWTVILAVGAAVVAAVVVPRLAGATPYTVLTGSMRPELPPGTLVVTRPVDVGDVSVGDVITYQLRTGRPTVVTHRVVASGFRADGEVVLTTQGDANDVSDRAPVRGVQVRGRLWYAVPHLGRVGSVLDPGQRQLAVYAVAAGLMAYAGRMFTASAGRTRTTSSTNRSTDKEEAR